MLFDLRGIVGLLSPKAIFILAWGNAPGFGVRIPGAMPLAMLIMAVGQSERIPGAMPGARLIMAVGQSERIPGAMPGAMLIMAVGQSERVPGAKGSQAVGGLCFVRCSTILLPIDSQ